MRRVLLLLALALATVTGHAATLTGTLINGSIPANVSGYKVYLWDSSWAGVISRDSVVTGSSGAYSFTFPTAFSGGIVRLSVTGCGGVSDTMFYHTGASTVTQNLVICPYLRAATWVADTVLNSVSNKPVWGQKVYIVDSSATRYHKDSAYSDKQGVVFLPIASTVPAGNLRIYAAPACGTVSQTYAYSGSLAWQHGPTLHVCSSSPTVSGTVTNVTTSSPAYYLYVRIEDSVAGTRVMLDSVMTSPTGQYSMMLPATENGHTITSSVVGCGILTMTGSTVTGANMTHNLGVCASSAATVSGIVYHGNTTTPLAGQKLFLIDSVSPTNIYIDSVISSATGSYSFIVPPSRFYGLLRIWSTDCGTFKSVAGLVYNGYSLVRNLNLNPGTASTVSGTIYDINGNPAPGVNVTITRMVTPLASVSALTAANGSYTINLPCSWTSGAYLQLTTNAGSCGRDQAGWVMFTGANITKNDTVCALSSFLLSGITRKEGGGNAPNAKVWLIEERVDSMAGTTTLEAIDSTVSNSYGRYYFSRNTTTAYTIPGKGSSQGLRIKAALQPGDPAYTAFLPTYYDSSLTWNGSALTQWYGIWSGKWAAGHISLRSGSNPGGPGFIGGNVLLGANKSSGVGDPLSGRILILTDGAGKAVGFTYSDASGSFSFPNLPYGSYYVFGDAGGRSNPELQITLSPTTPRIANVIFEENSSSFTGRYENVSVTPESAMEDLRVFPNPAGNHISVRGLGNVPGSKRLIIRNLNGAIIRQLDVAAGKEPQISVGAFPAGMYLLELHTDTGIRNFRFIRN